MVFSKSGSDFVVRLDKGDIFYETMMPFVMEQDIKSAFFYGLGGAEWAELGLYDLREKQYHYKYFSGPLEINNITGNISTDEKGTKIHAHATISGPDMNVSGGHIKALGIAGTCELYIHTLEFDLVRKNDEETGLGLLDLKGE
jgi:predicted DNA-binding protein with PD1-like motif